MGRLGFGAQDSAGLRANANFFACYTTYFSLAQAVDWDYLSGEMLNIRFWGGLCHLSCCIFCAFATFGVLLWCITIRWPPLWGLLVVMGVWFLKYINSIIHFWMKKSILIAAAALSLGACSHQSKTDMADNPFLAPYDTKYEIPPFDKIEYGH